MGSKAREVVITTQKMIIGKTELQNLTQKDFPKIFKLLLMVILIVGFINMINLVINVIKMLLIICKQIYS